MVCFTPKMISAPTGTTVARMGTSSSSSSPCGNLTKVPFVLRSSTRVQRQMPSTPPDENMISCASSEGSQMAANRACLLRSVMLT